MKTKITVFFLLNCLFVVEIWACDVCNIFEYNTINNRSFIGLFYRHRVFNGYQHLDHNHNVLPYRKAILHEPEDAGFMADKTQADYETYTTWEIRANYTWKNKVNLMMILPYRRNVIHYEKIIEAPIPVRDSTMEIKGWGDAVLAADYMFKKESKNGKHIFRPGLAVNIPTGQYQKSNEFDQAFDPIVQPGTGAWAVILRMNYQYFNIVNEYGFNVSASYKKSETGRNQYLFADSYNFQSELFYQFSKGLWNVIPKAGCYVESAGYNFYAETIQNLTGGNSLFGNIGIDVNRKNVTFQTLFQQPVYEDLNGNQLGNAGRLTLGVIYNL
ncbi:MAG: hypothetical protein AAGI07_07730 [Bacteroidota bacterium]